MGLDINGTRFLLYAQRHGVSFERTAMIGRQQMLLMPDELKKNLAQFGVTENETDKTLSDVYAESFLKLLGADEIVSFDASPYENATVIHDFNQPIDDEFKNRFSVVLDGGTLEHVFNYPSAIKNCMEMVAEGGHFLAITPTNNHSGHGFYQFSPELFFRIFSAQNGFELQQIMIFEETLGSSWYQVTDPAFLKERVILINGQQTMLLVIAKKTKSVEVFGTMPQQSDYAAEWLGEAAPAQRSVRFSNIPFRGVLRLPLTAMRQLKIRANRTFGMLNRRPKHFKKVKLP